MFKRDSKVIGSPTSDSQKDPDATRGFLENGAVKSERRSFVDEDAHIIGEPLSGDYFTVGASVADATVTVVKPNPGHWRRGFGLLTAALVSLVLWILGGLLIVKLFSH